MKSYGIYRVYIINGLNGETLETLTNNIQMIYEEIRSLI